MEGWAGEGVAIPLDGTVVVGAFVVVLVVLAFKAVVVEVDAEDVEIVLEVDDVELVDVKVVAVVDVTGLGLAGGSLKASTQ